MKHNPEVENVIFSITACVTVDYPAYTMARFKIGNLWPLK